MAITRLSKYCDFPGGSPSYRLRKNPTFNLNYSVERVTRSPRFTPSTEFNLFIACNYPRGFYGAMAQENDKRQNKGKTFRYRQRCYKTVVGYQKVKQ